MSNKKSLSNISAHLSKQAKSTNKKLPPIDDWNPDYCGEIDMQVKANGDWFYNGSVFKRIALVKLFASVLKLEITDDEKSYYLVTPVEKVKIVVDDAPFVLTQWHWEDEQNKTMVVSTNLDDEFIINAQHPVSMNEKGELYVLVRRNLLAKVHRNVYYQWVDLATEVETEKGTELKVSSAGYDFCLGQF